MRLRLEEIRKRRLMTQEELGKLVGTSKANISRLESGDQEPRPSTIKRLAVALGVSTDELVDWGDSQGKTMARAA
jgi:transcriptional regulator with XRE-family HTH domain